MRNSVKKVFIILAVSFFHACVPQENVVVSESKMSGGMSVFVERRLLWSSRKMTISAKILLAFFGRGKKALVRAKSVGSNQRHETAYLCFNRF